MDPLLLKAVIAIGPVMVLLWVFDRLDFFDIITFREIATLALVGGAIACVALLMNTRGMDGFPIGFSAWTRYVSPVIEESLKAAPIVALFATNRLGYKLDSAIAGFAVGAGFSVIENGWLLFAMSDANIGAWLVRGFGTAVMHGGATALFAVISHEFAEHQAEANAETYEFKSWVFAPGLGVAIVAHSAFNHFPNTPEIAMALTLLAAPLTLFFVFARSELATRRWLSTDHDRHAKLLEEMRTGRFSQGPEGRALAEAASAAGIALEDVLAHAQLSTELVLRAEALLLGEAARNPAECWGDEEAASFARLDALEDSIGPTGAAISRRCAGITRNDVWELGRLRALIAARRR